MSQRDLPWNDVPADSDVVPGTEEPDPAEVEGDEGEEVDVSRSPVPDIAAKYHRDTLDERLAEEEPDRATFTEQDEEAGGIQARTVDDDEDDLSLDLAERDADEDADAGGDEDAEDAAIHIRPLDRI
jgi:hypothetical protein